MDGNKNPIIYGSFVGVFEHFAGLAPRTVIDFKQYFHSNNDYKNEIRKLNLKNNLSRLYKGSLPYLTGIGAGHAWMFSWLEASKKENKSKYDALYGMIGRAGHDIFMLPGDTVRMNSNIKNISTREAFKDIYLKYGYRGFFKGLTPSLLMNLPTGAIEFTTMLYLQRNFGDDGLKPFLYGMVTGVASSIVTCPLDTIKTCRQMQQGNNLYETYKNILTKRGWKGFFRGALLRSFQCSISYGTYEWLCKNMNLELDD